MDEEYSKQEEARRILDAIRHKESSDGDKADSAEKEFPRLPSEEAAELQAFIDSTIKSKSPPPAVEEDDPEPIDIDPISTDQIKVMRKFAAEKVEVKQPLKKTLSEFIIRAYFEMVAYFTPANRVQQCRKDGHHTCMNCGAKIALPNIVEAEGQEKDDTAATSPPAAH